MSVTLWKRHGKMSLKEKQNVPQLVQNYKQKFPELEKRFIRTLIISENKKQFENPSELRKLTRYLERAFSQKTEKQQLKIPKSSNSTLLRLYREDAAETEIMLLLEDDAEFVKKRNEIYRKYGLL